jgi:hypothetical protein
MSIWNQGHFISNNTLDKFQATNIKQIADVNNQNYNQIVSNGNYNDFAAHHKPISSVPILSMMNYNLNDDPESNKLYADIKQQQLAQLQAQDGRSSVGSSNDSDELDYSSSVGTPTPMHQRSLPNGFFYNQNLNSYQDYYSIQNQSFDNRGIYADNSNKQLFSAAKQQSFDIDYNRSLYKTNYTYPIQNYPIYNWDNSLNSSVGLDSSNIESLYMKNNSNNSLEVHTTKESTIKVSDQTKSNSVDSSCMFDKASAYECKNAGNELFETNANSDKHYNLNNVSNSYYKQQKSDKLVIKCNEIDFNYPTTTKINSNIKVQLQDIDLWNQFSSAGGTEMIITKSGR